MLSVHPLQLAKLTRVKFSAFLATDFSESSVTLVQSAKLSSVKWVTKWDNIFPYLEWNSHLFIFRIFRQSVDKIEEKEVSAEVSPDK